MHARLRKEELWKVVRAEVATEATCLRRSDKFKQLDPSLRRRSFFFFLNCKLGLRDPTPRPDIFALNIVAACKVFDTVRLITYQPFQWALPQPQNFILEDADGYLTAAECEMLFTKGWKVQHIADVARLRAILAEGSFFCGLGQLWLSLGKLKIQQGAFGHVGSCVNVHRSRFKKTHWLTNFLWKAGEEVYFSQPLHFPTHSFALETLDETVI